MFRKKIEKTESSLEDFSNFAQFGVTTIKDKDVEAEYKAILREAMSGDDGVLDHMLGIDDDNELEGIDLTTSGGSLPKDIADILGSVSMDADKDTFIEVNEEDMNDPVFQQELAAMGFQIGSGAPAPVAEKTSKSTDDIEELKKRISQEKHIALNLKRSGDIQGALETMRRLKTFESALTTAQDKEAEKAKSPDIATEQQQTVMLQAQLEREQKTAVRLKRAGDLSGALEALRKTKVIKQQLDQICQSKHDVDDVTDEDLANPEYLNQLKAFTSTPAPTIREDKETVVQDPPPTAEDLQQQILLKKQAALRLQKEGKKADALAAMKRMKHLQKQLEMMADTPGPSAAEDKATRVDRRVEAFSKLEQELVAFANRLMTEAKEIMASNDRTRAAELVKQRKYYTEELDKLRVARQDPRQQPPSYEIKTVSEKTEIVLPDIDPAELHVHIGSAVGLHKLKSKDLYVNFSIGVPTDSPVGGTTEAVNNGGADFEFNRVFKLPLRRSKGTQKSFGIRKAVFEVWRNRSLMRSPELVGKAYQELIIVKSSGPCQSSIRIGDLWVENYRYLRTTTFGFALLTVQIKMRVRTPLSEKQFRTVSTTKLVVGEYPPIVELSPVPNPILQTAGTATVSTLQRSFSQQLQDQEDPHNIDSIISYDVMEAELSEIEASLQQANISPEGKEALELRKESILVKKQLLEIDMQAGKLTLAMYLETLNAKISQDRRLVAILNKQGRKQDAVRALRRLKIMEQEVAGATANQ